ncbi:MAG: tetratricopeptide repeat protein [Verrucomicrobiae bacterium]|nr:tetratricopeptide repeat protein [Verrucomicrobiae bacterium]
MNTERPEPANRAAGRRHLVPFAILLALLVLLAWLASRPPAGGGMPPDPEGLPVAADSTSGLRDSGMGVRQPTAPQREPESDEIEVAKRVRAFVQSRLDLADAMARRHGIEVSAEFREFFGLASTGSWEDVEAAYAELMKQRGSSEGSDAMTLIWQPVLETFGVLEVAHRWPAAALLEYGREVLDQAPPGGVVLGGTDPGRFIPTLMNATDGEARVVLTQNTLADASYLDYLQFLHGDRLHLPSQDDSRRAFQAYIADAMQRFEHDRGSPQDARQIRPGEQIEVHPDGRVHVGGQAAVMAINEALVSRLIDLNPDLPFFMEESFPLPSLRSDAVPSGPLIQLGGGDGLDADHARNSVDYWISRAGSLLDDPAVVDAPVVRDSWANLALAQGSLLQDRGLGSEAEAIYRVARDLSPGYPDVVLRHLELLTSQGRWNDATRLVESAIRAAPENVQFQELLHQVQAGEASVRP